MDITGLPLILFLLLPGFLTINVAFLVGTFRRLSAFHGSAWSLLVSFILIGITYPTYVFLVSPPLGHGSWPGLFQILVDPSVVPVYVWIMLYVAALFFGVVFGVAERKGYVHRLFLRLGIDLGRHRDIWSSQFRDAQNVRVYLRDGSLLSGWPEYYSADRSRPGPELYLTYARIWSLEKSEWLDIEGVRGVLVHGDEVNRIEFLVSSDEAGKETIQ
jgi:hypothetical protein